MLRQKRKNKKGTGEKKEMKTDDKLMERVTIHYIKSPRKNYEHNKNIIFDDLKKERKEEKQRN